MGKFFGVKTQASGQVAFKIAAVYAIVGAAWIVFSDRLLLMFVRYPQQLSNLQTVKGWFFVLASAAMIHCLVSRYIKVVRRQDETLREVAQGISVSTGEAFFSSLVRHLAKALQADYAVICENVEGEKVQSLACYAKEGAAESCDSYIAGSPVARVMEEPGVFAYRERVKEQFPDSTFIQRWEIEAFLGIALIGAGGKRLGVIALMYKRPLLDISLAEEILPVFAVRGAVELARRVAERELQESEALLRVVFDGSSQLLGLLTLDGKLIKINRTAYEFIGGKEEDVLGRPFWETPWWTHSPELQQKLRQAIADASCGELVRFPAFHYRSDGKMIKVDFSLSPVKDDKGRVILLVPEGRIMER